MPRIFSVVPRNRLICSFALKIAGVWLPGERSSLRHALIIRALRFGETIFFTMGEQPFERLSYEVLNRCGSIPYNPLHLFMGCTHTARR
jgi:hypothetical protein